MKLSAQNSMSFDLSLYFLVLRKLEELEIPYVIIGAFAGTMYGIVRTTHDVDIIIDLRESDADKLAAAFPSPRYYADPHQMRNAIRGRSTFNIIDAMMADKVDLFMLSMDPRYHPAFEARTRRMLALPGEEPFDVWVARVEDVIVGKLMAWAEGRSYRHVADIYEMMVFHYLQASSSEGDFNEAYVNERADALGEDVTLQWQLLNESAREYVEQYRKQA